MNQSSKPKSIYILNTPLAATDYAGALALACQLASEPGPAAIEFSNTHILTMRRHDPVFYKQTQAFDYFMPDGMPLKWLLNLHGAKMKDRVYGPTFTKYAIENSPEHITHYFLGGFDECGKRLLARAREMNPRIKIVGSKHGFWKAEDEPAIIEEINRLSPDFIWLGLGAPKQQLWVGRYKPKIKRGVLMTVGFAFDVIAGTKTDAPEFFQRNGLTWLFRMVSEPRRLGGRYLKYNSLFIFYLLRDLFKRNPAEGNPA